MGHIMVTGWTAQRKSGPGHLRYSIFWWASNLCSFPFISGGFHFSVTGSPFGVGAHSKFVCGSFMNLWTCCLAVNLGVTFSRDGTLTTVFRRFSSTRLCNSNFAGEGGLLSIEVAFRQRRDMPRSTLVIRDFRKVGNLANVTRLSRHPSFLVQCGNIAVRSRQKYS